MKQAKRKNSFRRSRRKIIFVLMGSFLLLFAATLAAIYLTSYYEQYQENQNMLARYEMLYQKNGNPEENSAIDIEVPPWKDDSPEIDMRFILSSFYAVELDSFGNPVSIDTGNHDLYSEEALTAITQKLASQKKEKGVSGNFIYRIIQIDENTLVTLMDNTLWSDSFTTLFHNAFLIGSVMTVILFFCSILLSGWIIRPLEENDRRQRQFISDASHELKTPVSVVNANAELLAREIGTNQWLENIRYENNRMADLIHQLLTLARTEHNETTFETIDFSRIVTGELLPFESTAFEQGFQIESNLQDSVFISGNQMQLTQMISILIDNAISHSNHPGTISVSLQKNKGFCLLSVTNPGYIPEAEREQIFSRFSRRETERSSRGNHYGLGLAIVKNIVENHRGRILVSCADDSITFSISLPVK